MIQRTTAISCNLCAFTLKIIVRFCFVMCGCVYVCAPCLMVFVCLGFVYVRAPSVAGVFVSLSLFLQVARFVLRSFLQVSAEYFVHGRIVPERAMEACSCLSLCVRVCSCVFVFISPTVLQ